MHTSVGAIIKNEKGETLMIDRVKPPYGWACPAGHVDAGETPVHAMIREVKEETGLIVQAHELLHHEFVPWNTCSRGERGHDWYVFAVTKYDGDVQIEKNEAKKYRWISRELCDNITLEKVWQLWHKKSLL